MEKNKIKKNMLIIYIMLAYSITWISILPILTNTASENMHFLGAFGPSLASIIVIFLIYGKKGTINFLKHIFKFPEDKRWFLIAFSPFIFLLISVLLNYFITGKLFNFNFYLHNKTKSFNSTILWILPLIAYGIFEEIGWRGFALPILQKKYSALISTLILSLIWFFWHIPMFFYRFDFNLWMVIGFYMGLLSGSIIFTFIINGSGGCVFLTIIWHTLWNFVSTIDTMNLAPIMSTMLLIFAIFIIIRYGPKNLAKNKKISSLFFQDF